MKKRILAIAMCLIVATSVMTGCSQGASSPETTAQTQAATTATVAATANSQQTGDGDYLPLVKNGEDVTLTIGLMQYPTVEDYETNYFTKWLEEHTGINLDFVYFSNDSQEAATQLSLMISSGQTLPDIIWDLDGVEKNTVFEYGRDGYFIDLKPYFDSSAHFFNIELAKCSKDDQDAVFALGTDPETGGFYSFPEVQNGAEMNYPADLVFINQAWLDKLGLAMPTTTEELKTVLKAFAENDCNGNGKQDEIPFISFINGFNSDAIQYFMNAFLYVNDEYFFNADNGKLWIPYTSDEYRQGLIYFNELYKEGLISPLTYSLTETSDAEMTSIFTPADQVSIAGIVGAHDFIYIEGGNNALFDYEAMAPLKAATSKGGYAARNASSFFYHSFITCDCKNPELAFKLLDYMCDLETFRNMRYGKEGEQWEIAEPGLPSFYDSDATIKVLDGAAWAGQNNYTWHNLGTTFANYDLNLEIAIDDGSFDYHNNTIFYDQMNECLSIPLPEEVVYDIVYSSSERESISDIETPLKDYIKEARALFITGTFDPANDTDWQNYLDACDNQGLQQYLEVSQQAYDRMK